MGKDDKERGGLMMPSIEDNPCTLFMNYEQMMRAIYRKSKANKEASEFRKALREMSKAQKQAV